MHHMRLMPFPYTGPNMFFASANFLSQPKNLTAFIASSKTFVPAQKQFYGLSFYRSQNVLCWSKFFEPDKKII